MSFSFAQPAYDGARTDRRYKDWATTDSAPEDIWAADGATIAARSADLVRNDGYAQALINAFDSGVVGPEGLTWKSQYQEDGEAETTDGELAQRRATPVQLPIP